MQTAPFEYFRFPNLHVGSPALWALLAFILVPIFIRYRAHSNSSTVELSHLLFMAPGPMGAGVVFAYHNLVQAAALIRGGVLPADPAVIGLLSEARLLMLAGFVASTAACFALISAIRRARRGLV